MTRDCERRRMERNEARRVARLREKQREGWADSLYRDGVTTREWARFPLRMEYQAMREVLKHG